MSVACLRSPDPAQALQQGLDGINLFKLRDIRPDSIPNEVLRNPERTCA
jgi:hypothetical protein